MKKYLLIFALIIAIVNQFLLIDLHIQFYSFAIVLLFTGVPHGSLDYFVEAQTLKILNQKISIKAFLVKYLINMAAYGLFWFFFPLAAFIVFICLTAYHFGEIDWPIRNNTKLDCILYTIYGLEMIVFIITSHINEAAFILEIIVRKKISVDQWLSVSPSVFLLCASLLFFQLLVLLLFYKSLGWTGKIMHEFIVQSLILFVVIYSLPLYLSFGFYFGIWHSGLSFNLIRKQMNLADTMKGWMQLIKKAIPYATLAWIGLIILLIVSSQVHTQLILITNLFVGISILTLPHLQVFTKIKL